MTTIRFANGIFISIRGHRNNICYETKNTAREHKIDSLAWLRYWIPWTGINGITFRKQAEVSQEWPCYRKESRAQEDVHIPSLRWVPGTASRGEFLASHRKEFKSKPIKVKGWFRTIHTLQAECGSSQKVRGTRIWGCQLLLGLVIL